MKKSFLVFFLVCMILSNTSCQNKSNLQYSFYEVPFDSMVSEGFGLSEEEFFEKFPAEGYEEWEQIRTEGDPLYPDYTQYIVPEKINLAGLSCDVSLRFYDNYGLGYLDFFATGEDYTPDTLYSQLMALYNAGNDAFGEIDDSVTEWDLYDTLDGFLEDMEAGGGNAHAVYPDESALRSVAANWTVSDDEASVEAHLEAVFDWPIDESGARWSFWIEDHTPLTEPTE